MLKLKPVLAAGIISTGLLLATECIKPQAALSVTAFLGNSETGSRYNPLDANAIAYNNVFISNSSGDSATQITQVKLGIRRIASSGLLTAINGTIYATPMTGSTLGAVSGDVTNQILLGTFSLAGGASGNVTQIVTVNPTNAIISLNNQLIAGSGGFWIGLQFTGANATNNNNGWRVVSQPPTTGSQFTGAFGLYNGTTFSLNAFAAPTPNAFYTTVDTVAVPFEFQSTAGLIIS